jgi:SAM-dependent methyltransferase
MTDTTESVIYDEYYYRTAAGGPYERNARWLQFFARVAERIVADFAPRTVLDVGCAQGMLVEALRDRGVEADGIDVSAPAIEAVRADIRPFCAVGSIRDPLPRRYDLITCLNVLEHLPADEAEAAIAHLCAAADEILFSSAPDDFAAAAHVNVRPYEFWAGLFARQGFVRDVEFEATTPFKGWVGRFRRSTEPAHRQIVAYDRRLYALWRENQGLKARAGETQRLLAQQDEAMRARPSDSQLRETIADQQAHLTALNERLAFMSDTEQSLRAMLLDAHEELVKRDRILASQTPPTVQDLQRQVAEHQAMVASLHAQLAAHRSAPAAPNGDEHRETIARLQAQLDERRAQAAALGSHTAALEHRVEAMLASSSWKITAPLRVLKVRHRLGR